MVIISSIALFILNGLTALVNLPALICANPKMSSTFMRSSDEEVF